MVTELVQFFLEKDTVRKGPLNLPLCSVGDLSGPLNLKLGSLLNGQCCSLTLSSENVALVSLPHALCHKQQW